MIKRREVTAVGLAAQSIASRWKSPEDGNWSDIANWSAGIPGSVGIGSAIFDYRDFGADFTSGILRAVVQGGENIALDRLEIYATNNRMFYIQSAAGTAPAQITMVGSAETGRASIYSEAPYTKEVGFVRESGSSMLLELDAELDVTVGRGIFVVDATISGDHGITKYGDGRLSLLRANTFSGDITCIGGDLREHVAGALGNGRIVMSGGQLSFEPITDTLTNDLIVAGGNNVIYAQANSNITFSGNFSVNTNALLQFIGTPVSQRPYPIVLDFTSLDLTGGTVYLKNVVIGNAFVAQNLLSGTGGTQFILMGVDTNGFAVDVVNPVFDQVSYLQSTGGPLDLTFHINRIMTTAPAVTFHLTSGIDTVRFLQDIAGQGLSLDLSRARFNGDRAGDHILIECTESADQIYLPSVSGLPKLLTKGGNDWVTCQANSDVALGAGNDFAQGSGANDILFGGSGDDDIRGGGGDDTLNGSTGADRMEGGSGNDIFFLDNAGDLVIEDGSLSGGVDEVRVSGLDYVMGDYVENARVLGGNGKITGNGLGNQIVGSNDANTLYGADGNDILKGNGGADILRGGFGNDVLIGGSGKDTLTGGEGADRFTFRDPLETRPSRDFADLIRDFHQSEGDVIALSAIDADTTLAGNQAFTFIGTAAFGHHAGELRYTVGSANTYVEADLNGDGQVDMTIVLYGNVPLAAADFVL